MAFVDGAILPFAMTMRMERTQSLWIRSLQIIDGKFFFVKDHLFIAQVLIFLPQVQVFACDKFCRIEGGLILRKVRLVKLEDMLIWYRSIIGFKDSIESMVNNGAGYGEKNRCFGNVIVWDCLAVFAMVPIQFA